MGIKPPGTSEEIPVGKRGDRRIPSGVVPIFKYFGHLSIFKWLLWFVDAGGMGILSRKGSISVDFASLTGLRGG